MPVLLAKVQVLHVQEVEDEEDEEDDEEDDDEDDDEEDDEDLFSVPIRSCTVFTLLAFWSKGGVVAILEVMVEVFGRSLGFEHT